MVGLRAHQPELDERRLPMRAFPPELSHSLRMTVNVRARVSHVLRLGTTGGGRVTFRPCKHCNVCSEVVSNTTVIPQLNTPLALDGDHIGGSEIKTALRVAP